MGMIFDPISLAIIGATLTYVTVLRRRINQIEERLGALEKHRRR